VSNGNRRRAFFVFLLSFQSFSRLKETPIEGRRSFGERETTAKNFFIVAAPPCLCEKKVLYESEFVQKRSRSNPCVCANFSQICVCAKKVLLDSVFVRKRLCVVITQNT
jgi:hypothetical protein